MRRHNGFTLLEILVALVVLGFLLVALTQGVRFGVQAWGMQTRGVARTADLDATQQALRRLIEVADPGEANEAGTFQGQAHTLGFRSRLPAEAGEAGLLDCTMALGVDARQRLVLRATPHPHAELLGPSPPALQTVLLDGVDHVDFGYFRATGRGAGWHDTWTDSQPPDLVRLHIAFAGRDTERHWPDLIAAPQMVREDE